MSEYQVLARKYRPQSFQEVLGQEAIITTLKNAIKFNRLAHAYLFCGSRGTGKTTIARVFAKALNCQNPTEDFEPCNICSSCKEITAGNSLDVLEIDGASHRGIDDIRQINETVGYAASSGKYKIYIIDEVHMLTKEAFNALLKTLEEPPPKVKFFFATTEPHKVLATVLSRCQRFNLNRISNQKIIDKLRSIAQDLNLSVEEGALRLIASRAEGGLRDAESLFDQIIAFYDGTIREEDVASVLGMISKDLLFKLDRAGKEGDFSVAFEIAYHVFSQGKDLVHFVETLTEHFRHILLIKLSDGNAPYFSLPENEKILYEASAKLYSQEQCLTILDFLIESQNQIRFMTSAKIALEALLLRIMRTHTRIPVDFLVRRLGEIEQNLKNQPQTPQLAPPSAERPPEKPTQPPHEIQPEKINPVPPVPSSPPKETPPLQKIPTAQVQSISIDPNPSKADLGIKETPAKKIKKTENVENIPPPPVPTMKKQSRYDTVLQFAAVELEGAIQKKQNNRY